MNQHDVIIIGAGLSGLYAALLLEKAGIDYVILEGRDRTGGRILSLTDPAAPLEVDVGPAWVWPDLQLTLAALIQQLDIAVFAQNEQGHMLYEQAQHSAPQRHHGYASSPASMRLAGGMHTLTQRLAAQLPPEKIVTSQPVSRVVYLDGGVQVYCERSDGSSTSFNAAHILLALPPGLAADLTFSPPLPGALRRQWSSTATWMAPHAKYVAVYPTPFWQQQGLSGEARSSIGPMVEIHDASAPISSQGALFGFIGIPAKARWTTSETNLKKLCRAQLVRLFGEAAANPVAEYVKDWACDRFTAREADLMLAPAHALPACFAASGPWQSLLTGSGSEWSHQFPGYLAGAIDAAATAVERYLRLSGRKSTLAV